MPPDKVEEFDAIVQNLRKKLEIPVRPAMPCVARVRIPTAKTPKQKVPVSKEGGRRLFILNEGRLSLTKRERQRHAFESQR